MGFCKKCFFESPYASETILKPELSTAHLGIAERDLEIERQIQLQPHIVYFTYTGDATKVGVTRESQIPTRWIDQGATLALPIARTDNRYEAGIIEVELKTPCLQNKLEKMLKDKQESIDLIECRNNVLGYLPNESKHFALIEDSVRMLSFLFPPEKNYSFHS